MHELVVVLLGGDEVGNADPDVVIKNPVRGKKGTSRS